MGGMPHEVDRKLLTILQKKSADGHTACSATAVGTTTVCAAASSATASRQHHRPLKETKMQCKHGCE